MSPRRVAVVPGVLALSAVVVAAVFAGGFSALARPPVDVSAPASSASSSAARATPTADPFPEPGGAGQSRRGATKPTTTPAPVLTPVTEAPKPNAAKVRARIEAVDDAAVGATFSGAVLDVGSGDQLYAHRARTPVIPASTTKLLTSVAALDILGPEHEFTTAVVSPAPGRIVLVGGGDPYLASRTSSATYPKRSSLEDLAEATAKELKRTRQTTVALAYDASLFSGPDWNEDWPSGYRDQVSPVSALWVDEGRRNGLSPGPREIDPAKSAARAFAQALQSRGVTVSGVAKGRARPSDAPVAEVSSMPLERIVEHLLLVSDNDAAEVVFRHAGLGAGRAGSTAAARVAVSQVLTRLGALERGTVIRDGSGLSRTTRVPAATMVKVLRIAGEQTHPELRSVLTGLPVAGVEGSLRDRFRDARGAPGIGVMHGKTGTLSQVHSLAGIVRSADGSLMVFAFLVNDPADDYGATVWLDHVGGALSRCGCR